MLSGLQTLLGIAVLAARREVSLWHDGISSRSSILVGSQYVEGHPSSGEDGIVDTFLLRINTLPTQLKVHPESCPLRIVDMWIGKPPAT